MVRDLGELENTVLLWVPKISNTLYDDKHNSSIITEIKLFWKGLNEFFATLTHLISTSKISGFSFLLELFRYPNVFVVISHLKGLYDLLKKMNDTV